MKLSTCRLGTKELHNLLPRLVPQITTTLTIPPSVGLSADRDNNELIATVCHDQQMSDMLHELLRWHYARNLMYTTIEGTTPLKHDRRAPHGTMHLIQSVKIKFPLSPKTALVWIRQFQHAVNVLVRGTRSGVAPQIKYGYGRCQCVTRSLHRLHQRLKQRLQQRQRHQLHHPPQHQKVAEVKRPLSPLETSIFGLSALRHLPTQQPNQQRSPTCVSFDLMPHGRVMTQSMDAPRDWVASCLITTYDNTILDQMNWGNDLFSYYSLQNAIVEGLFIEKEHPPQRVNHVAQPVAPGDLAPSPSVPPTETAYMSWLSLHEDKLSPTLVT